MEAIPPSGFVGVLGPLAPAAVGTHSVSATTAAPASRQRRINEFLLRIVVTFRACPESAGSGYVVNVGGNQTSRGRSVGERVLSGSFTDRQAPSFLEVPEAPRTEGDCPGEGEDPDDGEARTVEIEVLEESPDGAIEMRFLAEQADQLDRPDRERHEDRQPGDGEVVEELAHGAGEGPVIGEVHEAAVEGVEQGHPRREQERQREDRVEGEPFGNRATGEYEQRNLGRGVEPETEEDAERVHLPRLVDARREAA